nr:efflux RND transporter periplasmic adaptor subunit [Opitutaceae bacterium]
VYAHAGTLQFADITVDATTGTVRVRALVPNPQRELLPGMFVRARIEEGVNPTAILVPQQGISRNQRGQATAMIVSGEGKAEMHVLAAEHAVGSEWLVTSGLSAGDQVIVQNLQRVRPGSAVKPVPATNLEPTQGTSGSSH